MGGGESKSPRAGGDPMTPENARARSATPKRGGNIEPENYRPRKGGDPMSHDLPNKQIPMPGPRKSEDSKTTLNPFK